MFSAFTASLFEVSDRSVAGLIHYPFSNAKALPAAFLRRCIFHYIEFPASEERLQQVLATQQVKNTDLSRKAIEVILELRQLDLSKKPGLSELLDWVGYLEAVEQPIADLDRLPSIGALLKQEGDRQRAVEALAQK